MTEEQVGVEFVCLQRYLRKTPSDTGDLAERQREQAGAPGHRRRLYAAAAAAAKLHRWQPTRLPRPWDSPGKNTGVGCHFLLQCMKVKSEREVAQSCPTLSDPMDCSPPGFSVYGIFQARVLEWGAIAFSGYPLRHP